MAAVAEAKEQFKKKKEKITVFSFYYKIINYYCCELNCLLFIMHLIVGAAVLAIFFIYILLNLIIFLYFCQLPMTYPLSITPSDL